MSYNSEKTHTDLLSVTAFFSALLHAAIILGISFKLPEIGSHPSTDNTLDVVLLNSSNNESPTESELISSSDNAGGGVDDREAQTRLPWKAVNPSTIQSVQKIAQQQPRTSITPDQYITSTQGELKVQRLTPEKTRLESQKKASGTDQFNTNARQLERERLLAKINRDEQEYNKRPRKEFLSPTTKAHGAAEYLDSWRKRVTDVGNANYPIQIKAKGLHGSLILTIQINRDGTIAAIDIMTPSKHKLLNETAKRILRDASPFEAFPEEEFFKNTDILVITRTIHFLPDNKFSSTAAKPSRG